jgi:autotransporter-associated beta strand protein
MFPPILPPLNISTRAWLPLHPVIRSVAIAAAATIAGSAQAADFSYVAGTTATTWTNPASWTPAGGPPGLGANVGANIIGFTAGAGTASLTFNDSPTVGNIVYSTNGSTLTLAAIRAIGTRTLTVQGDITVDNPGNTLQFLPNTSTQNMTVSIAGNIDVAAGTLNFGLGTATGLFALTQNAASTTTVAGALEINLTNNATAVLGNLDLQGGTVALNTGNTGTATGTVISSLSGTSGTVRASTLASRTATLTITNASGASDFGGVVENGNATAVLNLVKTGAGTQVLSGINTYTGNTTVSAGTLQINGSTAAGSVVTVQAGGTLGGTGTVGGNTTIQAGATLAPGNSPGILSFGSNLTLEGNVVMELNGLGRGTGYDGIDVAGALAYGGGLVLNFGTTFVNGSSFNLFDFASSTDSFDTITLSGSYIGSLVNSGGIWSGNIGGQDFEFLQADGTLNVVPEPSAALLLALAGAGFAAHRMRSRLS